MKKKTERLIILIWLVALTILVFRLDEKINWLQNEQDNIIEVLLTGK